MRKIIFANLIAMAALLTASQVLASDVQCPSVEQIKQEWKTTTFRHIEQIDNQINFYVSPHHYGTDKNWYITISITDTDVARAREKANLMVNTSSFVKGGLGPFGFYSCGYATATGEIFFALANKEPE